MARYQDVTVAVDAARRVPGYGPWSVKAGVLHVQPPVGLLERVLTVRVHLDACGADNGPVRVIPGSHRRGWLAGSEIASLRSEAAVHLEFGACRLAGGLEWSERWPCAA